MQKIFNLTFNLMFHICKIKRHQIFKSCYATILFYYLNCGLQCLFQADLYHSICTKVLLNWRYMSRIIQGSGVKLYPSLIPLNVYCNHCLTLSSNLCNLKSRLFLLKHQLFSTDHHDIGSVFTWKQLKFIEVYTQKISVAFGNYT